MAPEDAKAYGIIDAVYTLPGDSLIAQAHDAGLAGGEGSSVTGRGRGRAAGNGDGEVAQGTTCR